MRIRYGIRLFSIPLLALLVSTAHAQPFSSATGFGGASSDVAEAVAVDVEGSAYVVGTFEGTIDFGGGVTLTSAGDSDAFVVKYDADGVAQWARRMGTAVFNDFGEAAAMGAPLFEPPEAIYVAGTFTGVATFDGGANPDTTLTTFSDFDAFLARYTPDGDLLWVRRVGGALQDVAKGVAVDPYDPEGVQAVYLAGSFTGEAEAGDTTLVSAGSSDAFLARYTPEGALVWARSAGGTDSDGAYDVAVDADDNAFVAGQFNGVAVFEDGIALQSVGLSDLFVVRYGGGGTAQWAERLGGSGSDYARGIALQAQGEIPEPRVFVAGSFSDAILVAADVLTSAGFTDVLLASLDPDGTPLWGRRGGGPGFDFAEDVQTLPTIPIAWRGDDPNHDPPAYVTGYVDGSADFSDPDTTVALTSAGGLDGFLAAYKAGGDAIGGEGGELLNAFTFGGTDRDQGSSVAVSIYVDPVLAGSFRSTATFGSLALESTGSNDGFVAALVSCPSLFCVPSSNEASPENRLALLAPAAPNPARTTTTLALMLERPQRVTAEVLDVLGRRVAVLHDGLLASGVHRLTLDAAALPAGLYVVRLTGEGFRAGRSVTVVR